MGLSYKKATKDDIEPIYELCKQLIDKYEQTDAIDYPKVLNWVRKKIESSVDEYTVVYADGVKAAYYHFFKNDKAQFEIDDLYVLPEFRNKGIGSEIIKNAVCRSMCLLSCTSLSGMRERSLCISVSALQSLKR